MKRFSQLGVLVVLLGIVTGGAVYGQDLGGVGIRAGIGTDISLGLAIGGEINYTKVLGDNALELGLGVFGGSFEEDTEEGIHMYTENTDLLVVGVLANYLFQYSLEKSGPYFVVGLGVGVISVDWEEQSGTDTSLGTPLPGGGSKQTEEGSSAGTLINLGIGHRFSQQFDLRGQVATFFIASAPGESTSVVPTLTVTVGYRF